MSRTRSTAACARCSPTRSPTSCASSGRARTGRAGTRGRCCPGLAMPVRRSSTRWAAGRSPTSRWTSPTASASGCRSSCRSSRRSTLGCRWSTTSRSPPATISSRRGWSTTGPAPSSSSSGWRTAATSSIRSTASSASSTTGAATSPARTGPPARSGSVRRKRASSGRFFSICRRRPCPAFRPSSLDGSSSRPTSSACSCRIPGIRTTG